MDSLERKPKQTRLILLGSGLAILVIGLFVWCARAGPSWKNQLRLGMSSQEFKACLGRAESGSVITVAKAVNGQPVREENPVFSNCWHRDGFVIWAEFDNAGIATKLEITQETDPVSWSDWFERRINSLFR